MYVGYPHRHPDILAIYVLLLLWHGSCSLYIGTDKDSRHICFRHSCILCNPLCLSWNILISHSQDRCNSHSIHHTHIHIFLRIQPLSLVFCTETKALSHHPSRVLRLPVSCSLHPLPVFLCDISLTFHRLQEMFYCHVHFRDARCSQVSNHFHHRLFLSHRRILLYVRLYETSHFPGPFHSASVPSFLPSAEQSHHRHPCDCHLLTVSFHGLHDPRWFLLWAVRHKSAPAFSPQESFLLFFC